MQFSFSNGPITTTARVDPRRPDDPVVGSPAHDGGVSVGGQRDRAPLSGGSNRAGADQLVALLGPNIAAAGIDPRRPGVGIVFYPAHDGDVAVGGQCDGVALLGGSNRAGADQLAALLGPYTAATRVDPRRPSLQVVKRPAHDGGVAVSGQRDGDALLGGSNRASASQLAALLGPDTAAAAIDPRRPGVRVVGSPAHGGGVSVGGQRDGAALSGGSNRAGADQLVALLGPNTAAAGIDPHRPGVRVVFNPAHDGGVAVGGQRDRPALLGGSNRPGADQLAALLGPDTIAEGVDPRRPGAPVVERACHDGGVAVSGQRDGDALSALSNRPGADQLAALLGPDAAAEGVDPRCPSEPVIDSPAHDDGVAVGRKRDGPALLAGSNRERADQLRSLLRKLHKRRLQVGLTCAQNRTWDQEKRGQPIQQRSEPLAANCSPWQEYLVIGPRLSGRNDAA